MRSVLNNLIKLSCLSYCSLSAFKQSSQNHAKYIFIVCIVWRHSGCQSKVIEPQNCVEAHIDHAIVQQQGLWCTLQEKKFIRFEAFTILKIVHLLKWVQSNKAIPDMLRLFCTEEMLHNSWSCQILLDFLAAYSNNYCRSLLYSHAHFKSSDHIASNVIWSGIEGRWYSGHQINN